VSDRTPTNPAQYQAIVRQTSGDVTAATSVLSTGGAWSVPVRTLLEGTGGVPVVGPAYGNLYAAGSLVGASAASLTGVDGMGPTVTVVSTTETPRITIAPAVSIPPLLLPTAGQDPPTSLSGIEILDLTTTATAWLSPSICTHPDGGMTAIGIHNGTDVSVWHRPLAGSWGARLDLSNYSAPNGGGALATPFDNVACVVALPDGGWVAFAVDANKEIVSWRSAPDEHQASTVKPRSLAQYVGRNLAGYTLLQMRGAYANGQISLVVSGLIGSGPYTGNEIKVYASSDLGGTMTLVNTITDAGYADVTAWDGGFVLAYCRTSVIGPSVRRSSNAFDGFLNATETNLTALSAALWRIDDASAYNNFTAGELSICADDTGTIWLFGSDHNFAGGAALEAYVLQSLDGGISWSSVGTGLGPAIGQAWWRSLDAGTSFRKYQMCAQGSRIVGIAKASASVGNAADSSLVTFSIGGLSLNPMPQTGTKDPTTNQASGWDVNWAAINLPQNTGATWTFTTPAGAPGVTLTALGLRTQGTTLADIANWTATPALTLAGGVRVEARGIRVDSGYFELRARIGDGTPRSYDVRVRCTPTTVTVTDMNGGGVGVPSTLYTETATVNALRIWLYEHNAAGPTARVLVDYLSNAAPKIGKGIDEWYTGQTGFSIVQPGNVTTDRVSFAFGGNGVALLDGYVETVSYGVGGNPGINYRLLGQALLPITGFVGELGLKLAGIGLFPSGSTWQINTTMPYPAANTNPLVKSSPQSGGRFDQAVGTVIQLAGTHDGGILAVCLRNCNFETATFGYLDPIAGAVTRAVDLKIGTGLQYTRTGTIIQCDPAGGNNITDYLPAHTLAGATFRFGGGGAIRKIARNTGGRWSTTATMGVGLRPVLTLEGVDGTEAASGAAGSILSPDVTVLLRNVAAGATNFSLTVGPTSTASGYIEVGKAFVGTALVFARRSSRGEQHSTATNIQTTEAKDGTRRVVREGAVRRAESMDWVDGVDTSDLHRPSPDYVTSYTGGTVVGNWSATPFDMFGLLASDGENCMVYLPKVPVTAGAANVTTITARDLQLYGRIVSDTLQMDVVLGNAWTGSAGELIRMGTLLIEEEL
jgi:hypothetical protein